MTYFEKLRDPRWQRKRLEVMARAEFRCESCDAVDKPFNVHHRLYRKGAEPWDYADEELVCLCEDCHEVASEQRRDLNEAIARVDAVASLDLLIGYADGIAMRYGDSQKPVRVVSCEHADGIAAAFGLRGIDVTEARQKGCITAENLYALLGAPKAGEGGKPFVWEGNS